MSSDVTIRLIDVTAGIGEGGVMPDHYKRLADGSWMPTDAVRGEIIFPASFIQSLGLHPDYTDLVTARGDSMSPLIEDGDWLFVDRRVHRFSIDDIYLIIIDSEIQAKSLAKTIGPRGRAQMTILSANPTYPPNHVPVDDIRIIGRVRHRIGKIVRGR